MNIKLSKKSTAWSFLIFIIVQTLAVVIGLCHKYICAPTKLAVIKEESKKIYDCRSDIFYGAIRPLRNQIEPIGDENRVFSISLVGTTSATTITASTGPSGDIVAADSTMDFPV